MYQYTEEQIQSMKKVEETRSARIPKMKDLVHEADPSAYISINEVADVFRANN